MTAVSSAPHPAANSPLDTLTPNQLQQAIQDSVTALIWIGKYSS